MEIMLLIYIKDFMNYLKIYNDLINSRKLLNRNPKEKFKYNNHHILPRSMGGTDEKFNLVLLTYKEHWVAHLLLLHIADKQDKYKMAQAIKRMCGKQNREKMNSRMYEKSKKIHSQYCSDLWKNTLIVKDSKTGIMIGHVLKDHPKVLSGEWVFFHTGLIRTDEYKNKISNAVTGKSNPRFSGIENEKIVELSIELYKRYNYWTINILRYYAKVKYDLDIPKYFSKFRKDYFKNNLIENILINEYSAKKEDVYGIYVKHHTNRILKEIDTWESK